MDTDAEEEEEGEIEGERLGGKIKSKPARLERKMLPSIRGSIQSNQGKKKRKGKFAKTKSSQQRKNSDVDDQDEEMHEELRSYHQEPKRRQQEKKKTMKPHFVRPAPPRSPVKIDFEDNNGDIDDQDYDYEEDNEYPEMQKEFDLLKDIPDSNYDEPYYDSNYK